MAFDEDSSSGHDEPWIQWYVFFYMTLFFVIVDMLAVSRK